MLYIKGYGVVMPILVIVFLLNTYFEYWCDNLHFDNE